MGIINDAAEHIEKNEVKMNSVSRERIIVNVKDHIVIFEKKAGRTEYSCDCRNYSTFCKSPVLCSHIFAACTYCTMRKIKC